MPWSNDGPRILPADLFKRLNGTLINYRADYYRARDAFLVDYAQCRDVARANLGALFNDNDFPHPDKVSQKFTFEFSFDALPAASDFRVARLRRTSAAPSGSFPHHRGRAGSAR
jgi:hypothetical protein